MNFSICSPSMVKMQFGPTVNCVGSIGPPTIPVDVRPRITLGIPWHPPQNNPFSLLSWHSRISDFCGREQEIKELERWIMQEDAAPVKFIVGEGGTGKSRLAAEFAEHIISRGWNAGFIDLRKPQNFPIGKGVLLVIDYPEENQQGVRSFLQDLSQISSNIQLRVLFLTRQHVEHWEPFLLDCGSSIINIVGEPLVIDRIEPQAAHEIYHSALMTIEKKFDIATLPLSFEAMSAWLSLSPKNDCTLFVLAAAIYATIHPDEVEVRYDGRGVINELVKREIHRLRRTAIEKNFKNHHVFTRLLVMATIAGQVSTETIKTFSSEDQTIVGFPPDRDITTEVIGAGLYSEDGLKPLEPDLLAAGFCAHVLADDPQSAPELMWRALTMDMEKGVARLSRIIYDAEITLGNRKYLMSQGLAQALNNQFPRSDQFIKTLSKYRDHLYLLGLLPADKVAYKTLIENTRDNNSQKAAWLNSLSICLYQLGDNQEALVTIQEAVEIYRCLAVDNPEDFESELAGSLNNLSNRLSEAGDRHKALV